MIDLPIVRLPTDRSSPACPTRLVAQSRSTFTFPSYGPTAWSARLRGLTQRPRHRTAGCPVDQLDRMDNRDIGACRDLGDAADIAGGDHIGRDLHNIPDLW